MAHQLKSGGEVIDKEIGVIHISATSTDLNNVFTPAFGTSPLIGTTKLKSLLSRLAKLVRTPLSGLQAPAR